MTLQTMVDYASIIICGKKVAFEHGKVHWKVEYYALLYCFLRSTVKTQEIEKRGK